MAKSKALYNMKLAWKIENISLQKTFFGNHFLVNFIKMNLAILKVVTI